MHNVEILVKGKPRCTLQIHPDDASRFGVVAGAPTRVRSRVGEVEIPAEIADVLYMPMDDTGRWQIKLAKALRAAGMDLEAVM